MDIVFRQRFDRHRFGAWVVTGILRVEDHFEIGLGQMLQLGAVFELALEIHLGVEQGVFELGERTDCF